MTGTALHGRVMVKTRETTIKVMMGATKIRDMAEATETRATTIKAMAIRATAGSAVMRGKMVESQIGKKEAIGRQRRLGLAAEAATTEMIEMQEVATTEAGEVAMTNVPARGTTMIATPSLQEPLIGRRIASRISDNGVRAVRRVSRQ